MKRFFTILTLLLTLASGFSQSNKELKQMYLDAKDSGSVQYVILNTGEKKEIKDLSFPGQLTSKKGKIEFADGSDEKYDNGRIHQCQTNEGYFKLATYMGEGVGFGAYDSALATRMKKGAIHVYRLQMMYKERFKNDISTDVMYFIEVNNNGRLLQLRNDPKVVDEVEGYVSKSKRAVQVIAELKKRYGKLAVAFSTGSKLLEAVDFYNDDFKKGKLTKE